MQGFVNPDPTPGPETRAFWDAAAEGRFLLKHCTACDKPHWYPRGLCPFCFSDQTEWREASGKGTIYSFAPMRRVPVPFVLAYVTLDEGVTMMTNIVGTAPVELATGQKVQLTFGKTEGGFAIPLFERVAD